MRASKPKKARIAGSLALATILIASHAAHANFDSFQLRGIRDYELPKLHLPSIVQLSGDRDFQLSGAASEIAAKPGIEWLRAGSADVGGPGYFGARVFLASLSNEMRLAAQRLDDAPKPANLSPDGVPKNLSGTVAIRIAGSVHERNWAGILSEAADVELSRPCAREKPLCNVPLFRRAQQAIAEASRMDIAAKARHINTFVNRSVRFQTDFDNYGVADHWARLAETLRRGSGDCEDFAIVKMWMLRAAGVNERDIHLVIGRETLGQRDHAVLAVRIDAEHSLYLDNLHERVYAANDRSRFSPLVSLGTAGTYVHGRRNAGLQH